MEYIDEDEESEEDFLEPERPPKKSLFELSERDKEKALDKARGQAAQTAREAGDPFHSGP